MCPEFIGIIYRSTRRMYNKAENMELMKKYYKEKEDLCGKLDMK